MVGLCCCASFGDCT